VFEIVEGGSGGREDGEPTLGGAAGDGGAPGDGSTAGDGGTAGDGSTAGDGGTAGRDGVSGGGGASGGGSGGTRSARGGEAGTGPSGGGAGAGAGGSTNAGTLPCNIQAILKARCQTCHKSPPINRAPMALLTYEQVQAYAPLMQAAVEDDKMPPPGAADLSEAQAATLVTYLSFGAPSAGNVTCP
jgi:hypothetical protein